VQTLAKPAVQRGAARPVEYLCGGQLEHRSEPGSNMLWSADRLLVTSSPCLTRSQDQIHRTQPAWLAPGGL